MAAKSTTVMGIINIPIPEDKEYLLESVFMNRDSPNSNVFFLTKQGMGGAIQAMNLLADNAFKLLQAPMYGEVETLWYCPQKMFNNFFYDISEALENSDELLMNFSKKTNLKTN